jgi:hypothetical protein
VTFYTLFIVIKPNLASSSFSCIPSSGLGSGGLSSPFQLIIEYIYKIKPWLLPSKISTSSISSISSISSSSLFFDFIFFFFSSFFFCSSSFLRFFSSRSFLSRSSFFSLIICFFLSLKNKKVIMKE